MASLTPKHRSGEVTDAAMSEGIMNGAMALAGSMSGLYAAMQNASFVKVRACSSRKFFLIVLP